jgi:hypothetical protein
MSKYLIQDTSLTAIANEVRTLSNVTDTMNPSGMIEKLQSVNTEVSTQETILEDALALLATKTTTVVDNCNFTLTLTNFDGNIVVIIYTYLNDNGQIETTENDFKNTGTYAMPVLKNSQIVLMGVSGGTPVSHTDSGNIVAKRSFSDGSTYYAYSFECVGDCSTNFVY